MIYRVRTMEIDPGKAEAMRDVCLRGAAYATEHFDGIDVEILMNVSGDQRQLHMVTRCASLASLEAYEAQRRQDPGWMALVDEVHGLAGTTCVSDRLLSSVDTS